MEKNKGIHGGNRYPTTAPFSLAVPHISAITLTSKFLLIHTTHQYYTQPVD